MSIRVEGLCRRFGDFKALDGVTLDFASGELVALLGPSGCGKTTLLRIIAGLEGADAGHVWLDGEDASATHARERQVGFVFQHYALFRHMTVFENVAFGLRVKPRRSRPPQREIARRVHELLELVQLDWLADRFPAQLSGGQRQRIALARALAVEPRVLLLDEPFGALDAKVRRELRRWLRRLHDELKVTSVFVTHDQEEAMDVADRVVLMNRGRVEQSGTPDEVYQHPANGFVFDFLGSANRFGRIDGEREGHRLYSRPHDTEIIPEGSRLGGDATAQVIRILRSGPVARIELTGSVGDGPQHFEVELSHDQLGALSLRSGQRVGLRPRRAFRVTEPEAPAAERDAA